MWNCWINSWSPVTCSTTSVSSMMWPTSREEYSVALPNKDAYGNRNPLIAMSLFLNLFPPGMTQEYLCPILWKEVWWTLMADWCRATRSCQSMVRMSGRPLRRPWLRYSRYVWPSKWSIVSEWRAHFKLSDDDIKNNVPCVAVLCGAYKNGSREVQGRSLPLWKKAFPE